MMQEIASDGEQGKDQQIMCMPSRQTLEQMGEHRLVRGILSAGGFLYVAQQLGLRVSRRPNGYWDNIENLDEVKLDFSRETNHEGKFYLLAQYPD